MNLKRVKFIVPLKLQTHASEVGELDHMRDSDRDGQNPEADVPSWLLDFDGSVVRITIAKDSRLYRHLGGNRDKDEVTCVPVENVAWYRELSQPAPKKAKTKLSSIQETATQNPSLREGTTVHVPGIGDI